MIVSANALWRVGLRCLTWQAPAMLMLHAVRQRLGADAVRAGLVVERFEQSDAEVAVELRDRQTGRLLVESADVLAVPIAMVRRKTLSTAPSWEIQKSPRREPAVKSHAVTPLE